MKKLYKIDLEPVPLPIGREPIGDERDILEAAMQENIRLLCEQYGIPYDISDANSGWKLAFALAQDHVHGFAPKEASPGRPAHRPYDRRAGCRDLILLMEGFLAGAKGRSEAAAVSGLMKRLRSTGKSDWSDATAIRHYRRLKRRLAKEGPWDGIREAQRILGGGSN